MIRFAVRPKLVSDSSHFHLEVHQTDETQTDETRTDETQTDETQTDETQTDDTHTLHSGHTSHILNRDMVAM